MTGSSHPEVSPDSGLRGRLLANHLAKWKDRVLNSARRCDPVALTRTLTLWFTIIGLAVTFVIFAYYGTRSLSDMLSFMPNDQPGPMLGEMYPQPFGVHYFGDFLLPLRQSVLDSPYATEGVFHSMYPLFMLMVIRPLASLSYTPATAIFLLSSVLILLVPLGLASRKAGIVDRLASVAPFALSAPMIVVLDRGNTQSLVVGMALIGLLAYLRQRYVVAGVCFALSAAMKVYPVLLLLLLVKARKWRALGVSVAVGVFATLLASAMYDGNVFQNLSSLWDATRVFRQPSLDQLLLYNHSFRGGLAAVMTTGPSAVNGLAEWAVLHYEPLLLTMLAGLSALVVLRSTTVFHSVTYISVFLSFGVSISYGYAPVFMFLPVMVLLTGEVERNIGTFVSVVLIAFILAPKGFVVGGHELALYTYLNPLLAGLLVLQMVVTDLFHLRTRWRDLEVQSEVSGSA